MAKHKLQTVAPIETRFVLPPGAKIVGYVNDDFDRPIVRQTLKVPVKVPVLDADGKEVWKRNGNGTPIVQRFRNTFEEKEVEWTPHHDKRGNIRKNFHFRVDPAEVARLERAEKVKRTERELAEALTDSGVSVLEFVQTLKELKGTEPPKKGK